MCTISGNLKDWPSKQVMARLLKEAGFRLYVGRYSIRIEDFDNFTFQEYGGDLGDPSIEADSDDLNTLIDQARLVSDVLSRAKLVHRFEVYGQSDDLAAYFHY